MPSAVILELKKIKSATVSTVSASICLEVRNRFKGLDLRDRVPDELWNEVRDIVQETGIKTIPMEKKGKKAKWLSGEALQIAVTRREAKNKGLHQKWVNEWKEEENLGKFSEEGKLKLPSFTCPSPNTGKVIT